MPVGQFVAKLIYMTITVTQLNNYISGVFSLDGILDNVSVCGEITNVKKYKDCWYFSLKDDSGAINCMTFSNAVEPQQGMQAVVDGHVRYYAKNGSVSLYARRVNLTVDKGEAYKRFLELKDKLSKEGLFDQERKVPVPSCCYSVGIVTSPTGAVIRDIEQVALRRQPFINLILYPVKVQGDGADDEIAQGIRFFAQTGVDAIIVGRGGGSNEDLSVFNSEVIVRAIAECHVPIVSAVGHNVDYTLCDFAADCRAATPSEAAELVTIDVYREKALIFARLSGSLSRIRAKILNYGRLISSATYKIESQVADNINYCHRKVLRLLRICDEAIRDQIAEKDVRLRDLTSRLSQSNPTNILKKGYAFVTDNNGKKVTISKNLKAGDELTLTFSDGDTNVVVK